ncbi:MAG: hypothetical protein IPL77_04430 [Flavobacteriales bacterium]|nr:hypothetical protein [Flavobacteriales bacterium]MBK9537758.1 hypothetical protein [Flavobacteriales bacterium]
MSQPSGAGIAQPVSPGQAAQAAAQAREQQRQLEAAQRKEHMERLATDLGRLADDLRQTREAMTPPGNGPVTPVAQPPAVARPDGVLQQVQEPVAEPGTNSDGDAISVDGKLLIDSDGDGNVDAEGTMSPSGQLSVRSLLPERKEDATSITDDLSTAGTMLEVIDPDGGYSAGVQEKLGWAAMVTRAIDYFTEPDEKAAVKDFYVDASSHAAGAIPLSGALFDRFGTGIPDLINNTYSVMLDNCLGLLSGDSPDTRNMYRPLTNYLGEGALGISGLGDRAAEVNSGNGERSWGQRVWDYLLKDLRTQTTE